MTAIIPFRALSISARGLQAPPRAQDVETLLRAGRCTYSARLTKLPAKCHPLPRHFTYYKRRRYGRTTDEIENLNNGVKISSEVVVNLFYECFRLWEMCFV